MIIYDPWKSQRTLCWGKKRGKEIILFWEPLGCILISCSLTWIWGIYLSANPFWKKEKKNLERMYESWKGKLNQHNQHLWSNLIKEKVHPKMKIVLQFTHSHVVINSLNIAKCKRRNFKKCTGPLFLAITMNRGLNCQTSKRTQRHHKRYMWKGIIKVVSYISILVLFLTKSYNMHCKTCSKADE